MLRTWGWTITAALLVAIPAVAADAKYTIKQATTSAPPELKEPIRTLLNEQSVQLFDGPGLLAEVWFRKEVPAKATPEQVKNGITYRELEETTLLGAIRVDRQMTDYRKQKINPGVYTLRLGFQPMDGDHMGTAPYSEFCLLVPAKSDDKPDPMDAKALRELSGKAVSGGSHPSPWLLFPNDKPEETPKLVDKGNGHWALSLKEPVVAGSQKGSLGIALTLIGQTMAE
jgi:hypothetical protein